ncbi:hypothetical protein GCM10011571_35170 [Marinithermofilum abyssi]|uniref:Uncharacterized protein n=1 Tax=Marinithermofilum abyssi TaxID=1571185 RepID=A0A8J2VKT2_9BACL|nr:hypothetical protein GCM10011571_35170 [Marinithermofilum abyssi]
MASTYVLNTHYGTQLLSPLEGIKYALEMMDTAIVTPGIEAHADHDWVLALWHNRKEPLQVGFHEESILFNNRQN